MKLAYQTNTWGGVFGHPAGVTSVKDLYYLTNGSTEAAMSDISKAGYKGFELFDGNLMQFEHRVEHFRKLITQYNLKFIAVYSGANFIYEEISEEEFFKINKVAKFAASLGAQHLVVGGGAIRAGGIKDNDYTLIADSLDKVVEVANKYRLTPSFHPHLETIAENPEQLDRIMAITKINLCPDTAHLEAGGGDPAQIISKYAQRIKYVHLKDWKDGSFLPLGEGAQDYKKIMEALNSFNYDGWITVELDSYPDPLLGAQKSKQFLKETFGMD